VANPPTTITAAAAINELRNIRALPIGWLVTLYAGEPAGRCHAAQTLRLDLRFNAWQVALIKGRYDALQAGSATVPHEEVERWLDSLGTDHELPMPEPKS
jgi:hypothetical protein